MTEYDPRIGSVVGEKLRLRLVRQIGEGGMGTVYLAENEASRLPYAVKVLQPRLCHAQAALRRFLREALAASSIRHPGVISVVDVGTLADGTGYYAMELLSGEDLATTLARERRLAWPRALHVALQVCDAMASVHAHGIVHRDLKPANCFRMTRGDDPDAIKILDFGVAKITSVEVSTLTGADALIGTVPYMAPELFGVDGVRDGDLRGDVWAAGVLLFELLTGLRPFQAPNVFQLMAVITQRPTPPLASVGGPRDWPDSLDDVLARALCKDPARRFQDMSELAVALRSLAPVAARPAIEAAVADVDALARTVAQPATPAAPARPGDGRATLKQIRERAAFYVDPASRWSSEHHLLPGGTNLVIARGDLCLVEADAVVCGIPADGPLAGTSARRLCEFGGPEVAEVVAALPGLSGGALTVVGGGRLPASRVLFAVQPDEFVGLAPMRARIAEVAGACVQACVDRQRKPRIHSLAVPLLFSGAAGLPRRQALQELVEAFIGALAAAPPLSLGVLRLMIDDEGEQLARGGGELIVELPPDRVADHERVQRFVLDRYRTMSALGEAILAAIPPRLRPGPMTYGNAWSLQRPRSRRPLDPGLLRERAGTITPREAGISGGATLELSLHADAIASGDPEDPEVDADLRRRCAVIDWSKATAGVQGKVSVLCSGYNTATELLDDVWASFPPQLRPPPFTYGATWILRNRATGASMPYASEDQRPISALGFVPGGEFEVVLLP